MAGEFDAHERRVWAGKAEAYDRSFAALCAGAVPALLAAAAIGPDTVLLDVGTGPGTVAAAAVALGAEVTAVDAEPGMVALAAARVPGAEVRRALLPELPFEDAAFDTVVGNFVVNHVEDPVAALAELRRVVRPGGRVAVTIWHGTANRSMDLFGQALAVAGVERMELPTLPVDFPRTAEGFAGVLAAAGWSEVEARDVAWTHRVDPEDWWAGPAGGVANVGLVVGSQSPAMRARIKEEYDRLAGERTAGDGLLELPAVALLATARR
ncbi:class I SAM-dependent methyltransferase [Kitasatospora camelliae]|uniref:Class I SAM-dependent methyltransferase n=1 Tax=Kitasatospora camelliae TaxID=3156397 RepID=A0AAU8K0L5_9ACTN